MASKTDKYASPLKPTDEKLPKAMTLKELYHFLGAMIMAGANTENEVLIYKDPEGNGLVSVEAWAGIATVTADGWRYIADVVDSVQTTSDPIPSEGHVILSALHELDWPME